MKYLAFITLLLLGACQEKPIEPLPPEIQSMEAYQHYMDTLGQSAKDKVVTVQVSGHTATVYVDHGFVPDDEVGVLEQKAVQDTLPVKEIPFVADTIPQDTIEPDTTAYVLPLDTLNQVLGVTDLLFVWKGDTCSTVRLSAFLNVFEGACLTENKDEVKSHIIYLMLGGLLGKNPTGAILDVNEYLLGVLPCAGLNEYVGYANSH